jgi:hypothetical protein
MISTIDFMPGHMDFMTLKKCHEGESVVDNFSTLWREPGAILKTLVADEKPVAVIGLLHLRNGVAECIMGCGDSVDSHAVSFVKTVRSLHEEYVEKLKLHRIQITIRSDHRDLIRWADFLGFKQEGLMSAYGSQGADYFMYARVYGR